MPRVPWLLVIVLLTAPLTAGCIGGDGGGEDGGPLANDSNNTTDDFDAGSPDNGSGLGNDSNNTPGADTGNQAWTWDNRTGTAQGTAVGGVSEGGAEETWTVTEESTELQLSLNATGGDLQVCLQAPEGGGNASAASSVGAQQSCTESGATSSGTWSFASTDPAPGEWVLQMTPTAPSTSVDYELAIGQLQPTR